MLSFEEYGRQPELTTSRLLLRPFSESDADFVQQLLQSKEVTEMTSTIPHPYPDGAAKSWIASHPTGWSEGSAAVFAICPTGHRNVVMGAIGLRVNARDENGEIGFWIGRPFWGKGYCTEAVREIVQFGLVGLELQKLHAGHYTKNPASGRVLEKAGMEREGVLKSHVKKNGVFEDLAVYGIVRQS